MIYGKPVPRIDNILWLSKLAAPYPTTASKIVEVAKDWRFNKGTIEFLERFEVDEIFETRQDFINQAKRLEDLIFQKRGGFILVSNKS